MTARQHPSRRTPALLRGLPGQVRIALVAGVAALVLFGSGAWWLFQHVRADAYRTTENRAFELSVQLAAQAAAGKEILSDPLRGWPLIEVDRAGRTTAAAGGTQYLADLTALLPAPPAQPPRRTTGSPQRGTVHVGAVDERERDRFHRSDGMLKPPPSSNTSAQQKALLAHRQAHTLAHRTMTVFATAVHTPANACGLPTEADGSCRSTLYVFVPPDDAKQATASLQTPLMTGVPLAALLVATLAWTAARRSLRPVEAIRQEVAEITDTSLDRRVPVPDARDPVRLLAQTTNTTLDRLETAVERQHRFVADASHELRSPVAALRYELETALAHPDTIDPRQTLHDALTATRRIHTLTEDLLLLARPDHPAAHSLIDLAGLAAELVYEYRHRGHPVSLRSSPDQAPVRGDGAQLHRLLRNLLDNAVRHAHTAVVLDITTDGQTHTVSVHNDGTPLTPDECEHVFERFTRLDEARARDTGGSGLGLAIARDIAERHHGTLTAHSDHPRPGTTFTLTLPGPPDAIP
ncbi:sensor histidine kinase [Streptomyces telluris]|uniref:histidine kinase n=1 Tax=Streptomyces telluris TaxID=2720021 RepID=A0A9X2LLT4_9ACTN|nr:ATP-binding protein [Streptomyces telluris]MCQ8773573.1 ATP-binding protein [Streptomyces telluris]NJP81091.1 HAMP domain-containing protein [Streptomyces telluris]